ncbi:MAG: rRNA maturation RNase YbeY [Hyphomicrobiaceae bacterium]
MKGTAEDAMDTPGDIGPTTADEDGRESEPPPRRLSLEVLVEAGEWPDPATLETMVSDVAAAVQAAPEMDDRLHHPASACVAFMTDADVRGLNARFRGQDKPTNVLSFPAQVPPAGVLGPGEPASLGDIVLAAETVAREARALGIPMEQHVQHLVVHGTLHLLGYDHEADEDADLMEALETRILARLGVPDPYRDLGPGADPGAEPSLNQRNE